MLAWQHIRLVVTALPVQLFVLNCLMCDVSRLFSMTSNVQSSMKIHKLNMPTYVRNLQLYSMKWKCAIFKVWMVM